MAADGPVAADGSVAAAMDTPVPAEPGLTLHLLRHADAGDPAAWPGDDAERPLSKKGRRQARRLGRHLAAAGVRVDVLLTSPKVRAADTARRIGKALRVSPSADPSLGSGFDMAALRALVGALETGVEAVMLVGHDPDFTTVASALVGATIELRKGAIATIELPGRRVAARRGLLRGLLSPDALPG